MKDLKEASLFASVLLLAFSGIAAFTIATTGGTTGPYYTEETKDKVAASCDNIAWNSTTVIAFYQDYDKVIFNSSLPLKNFPLVSKVNAKNSAIFLNTSKQNGFLNLKCSINGTMCSNRMNLPLVRVPEFKHPAKFQFEQKHTLSCTGGFVLPKTPLNVTFSWEERAFGKIYDGKLTPVPAPISGLDVQQLGNSNDTIVVTPNVYLYGGYFTCSMEYDYKNGRVVVASKNQWKNNMFNGIDAWISPKASILIALLIVLFL